MSAVLKLLTEERTNARGDKALNSDFVTKYRALKQQHFPGPIPTEASFREPAYKEVYDAICKDGVIKEQIQKMNAEIQGTKDEILQSEAKDVYTKENLQAKLEYQERALHIVNVIALSEKVIGTTVSDFELRERPTYHDFFGKYDDYALTCSRFLDLVESGVVPIGSYPQSDLLLVQKMQGDEKTHGGQELEMYLLEWQIEGKKKNETRTAGAQLTTDVSFFSRLEKDRSMVSTFLSIAWFMFSGWDVHSEENHHELLDRVAWRTLLNYNEYDRSVLGEFKHRELVQAFVNVYAARGSVNRRERVLFEGHTLDLLTRTNKAEWQYYGKKLKHYVYRSIDPFSTQDRIEYTRQRVEERYSKAYRQTPNTLSMQILLLELFASSKHVPEETRREIQDAITYTRAIKPCGDQFIVQEWDLFCMPFEQFSEEQLWAMDTAMLLIFGPENMDDDTKASFDIKRKNKMIVQRNVGKLENETLIAKWSEEKNGNVAREPGFEDIVSKGDEVVRGLFRMCSEYSPEAMDQIERMGKEMKEFFDKYNLQNISKRDEEAVSRWNFYVLSTPWLATKRYNERVRIAFNKYWKEIKLLAQQDNLPWLFFDDSNGLMVDPETGIYYGSPNSREFHSEIQRRQNGIPSMHWYGKQEPGGYINRDLSPMDTRRLEGGDGCLLKPSPFEPDDPKEREKWDRDWRLYDALKTVYPLTQERAVADAVAETPDQAGEGTLEQRKELNKSPLTVATLQMWKGVVLASSSERGNAKKRSYTDGWVIRNIKRQMSRFGNDSRFHNDEERHFRFGESEYAQHVESYKQKMRERYNSIMGYPPEKTNDTTPTDQERFAYSLSNGNYLVELEEDLMFRVGHIVVPNMDRDKRNEAIRKSAVYLKYTEDSQRDDWEGIIPTIPTPIEMAIYKRYMFVLEQDELTQGLYYTLKYFAAAVPPGAKEPLAPLTGPLTPDDRVERTDF